PRTCRGTLGDGAATGVSALAGSLAAYAVNDARTAADRRVRVVQTAFWVVLGTALGVICQGCRCPDPRVYAAIAGVLVSRGR
ncbi:MAG: hypothetical protein WCH93_11820, partial [Actinomycetota bacterium]